MSSRHSRSSAPTHHAVLAGATGLIGRELAQVWLEQQAAAHHPATLHLLVRRANTTVLPGQQLHVVDFAHLPQLPQAEEAYCCLGTTIATAGSQAAFRAVDFDAVLAFAKAAKKAGVKRFAVVSALGADARSKTFYSRVKGETEQALRALDFATLVIARPSLLAGNRAALEQPTRWGERLALAISAPLSPLIPLAWRPVQARHVAVAMCKAIGNAKPGVTVLESAQLHSMGAAE